MNDLARERKKDLSIPHASVYRIVEFGHIRPQCRSDRPNRCVPQAKLTPCVLRHIKTDIFCHGKDMVLNPNSSDYQFDRAPAFQICLD